MSLTKSLNRNHPDDQGPIEDILTFWLEECTPKQRFMKDESFDIVINDRFGLWVTRGLEGKLERWKNTTAGLLALIILVDQFTRNIYRGTPAMVAGDALGLDCSQALIDAGELPNATPVEAHFALLPFMHSEDLETQQKGLPLFRKYTNEKVVEYARRHLDIIERFGRFPHRNQWLGRKSSPTEIAFLNQPGSRF